MIHLLCVDEPDADDARECLLAHDHVTGQLTGTTSLPGRQPLNAKPDMMSGPTIDHVGHY